MLHSMRIAIASVLIGSVASLGSFSSAECGELQWKEVAGVKVPVPPSERPRLYLRTEHIAGLSARLKDPVLRPIVERLDDLAHRREQFKLEWDAVEYLIGADRSWGARRSKRRWRF